VIPPPIDTTRFRPGRSQGEHYLVLSRLVAYKRIDLAVRACTRMARPLVVVGDGPDRARLEAMAGPTVRFVGRLPDSQVEAFVRSCRALLFPGEEDFGMAPLEVNAAGRPVVAFRAGGATETVIEGRTGVFFDEATPESLAEGIEQLEKQWWDPAVLRRHALRYDVRVFAARLLSFLRSVAPSSVSLSRLPGA
jgi:glycosyltransferase involved in cell wall biosynthesis